VNLFVTKGIPQDFAVPNHVLTYPPIILRLITLKAHALNQEKQPSLSNRHTNWDDFRHLNQRLNIKVYLKAEEDIEAADNFFNDTIQWAGWNATP
jgi:hypothetical protein